MKTHRTPRRSRLSRILVATLTVTLTIVTFVGLALAGAVVTDRQLHQPVPTGPVPATSSAYADTLVAIRLQVVCSTAQTITTRSVMTTRRMNPRKTSCLGWGRGSSLGRAPEVTTRGPI